MVLHGTTSVSMDSPRSLDLGNGVLWRGLSSKPCGPGETRNFKTERRQMSESSLRSTLSSLGLHCRRLAIAYAVTLSIPQTLNLHPDVHIIFLAISHVYLYLVVHEIQTTIQPYYNRLMTQKQFTLKIIPIMSVPATSCIRKIMVAARSSWYVKLNYEPGHCCRPC